MSKKFSVFSSQLITGYKPVPGSTMREPIYTPCLTMVLETKSSRRFGYVVFSIDHKATKSVIIYAQSTASFVTGEVKEILSNLCTPKGIKKYSVLTDSNLQISLPASDLLITYKADNLLFSSTINSFDYSPLSLKDRDTSNVSLNAYVNSIGTLMDTLGNPITLVDTVAPAITRKWCSQYKEIDWSLFWNSPYLTDEEKEMCRTSVDVQVAYSNKDRDIRKIIQRQFNVDYPSRNWVFNILHGVPGSGKTTMIMKDICALNNIPCLYIIGDARASISKMIAIVAPTEMPNGKVELTLTESVWAKALKYNLPLVVFIDEIDTMNTLDLKQLGTLATEGKAVINTTHYKNDARSICYFGAFNPGSANASEFPDSFEDRLMWFSVPKVSEEEQINYRDIAYGSKLNVTSKENIIQEYVNKLEQLKGEYPNLENKINNLALTFTSLNLKACNEEALKWFCDERIKSLQSINNIISFKEGKFVDVYAHQVGTIDYKKEVNTRISKFFNKMNSYLSDQTRGTQKTKRDRNACITIPDRCYDVFVDLIFSYSSVAKAFEFMIMNRLPEGFVLNIAGCNTKAGVDNAPATIYQALYDHLEADIKDLHNYLFNSVDSKEVEDEYNKYIVSLQHVAAQPTSSNTIPSLSDMVEDLKVKEEIKSSVTADEWDEVEDILG